MRSDERRIQIRIYVSTTDPLIYTIDRARYPGVPFMPTIHALRLPVRAITRTEDAADGRRSLIHEYEAPGFRHVDEITDLVSVETGQLARPSDPHGPTVEDINPHEPVDDLEELMRGR